jgi:APA family basic amino acid/polyamine antiporter
MSVLLVGGITAALAATGSVKTTWSFSAFTVLVYYAVTNLAALRLDDDQRLYGRGWARVGLLACLALAFAVDWRMWLTGWCVLGAGFLVRRILRPAAASGKKL